MKVERAAGVLRNYKRIAAAVKAIDTGTKELLMESACFSGGGSSAMYYCERAIMLRERRSALIALLERIDKVVSRLSKKYGQALTWKFMKGLSIKEAAKSMGVSCCSVKRWVAAGLELFGNAVVSNPLSDKLFEDVVSREKWLFASLE